jgi:F-type H+-transporting ATPase subunit b
MPQFDPASFAPQFVWLLIVFAFLYFAIVGTTLPRIGRAVENRETVIRTDIATAEAAKAEADNVREARERRLAEARGHAQKTVADAQARIQRDVEARLHEAHAAADARIESAMASLAVSRERASGEISRIAAEAAALIVERVTGKRPGDDAAAAAVVEGNA